MWPLTESNLAEMRRVDHQCNCQMIRSQLNNGLICETDSTTTIHIPTGWLHVTFTVGGSGFVAGITIVAAESIRFTSSWMQVKLKRGSDDPQGNLDVYYYVLEVALESRNEDVIRRMEPAPAQVNPPCGSVLDRGRNDSRPFVKKQMSDDLVVNNAIWLGSV